MSEINYQKCHLKIISENYSLLEGNLQREKDDQNVNII